MATIEARWEEECAGKKHAKGFSQEMNIISNERQMGEVDAQVTGQVGWSVAGDAGNLNQIFFTSTCCVG